MSAKAFQREINVKGQMLVTVISLGDRTDDNECQSLPKGDKGKRTNVGNCDQFQVP